MALDEAPADGAADRRFVLQQGGSFETVSGHYEGARVTVRDDQVRVDFEDISLLLIVEGNKPRMRRGEKAAQVVKGFGLSSSWGGFGGLPVDVVASESHYAARKSGPAEGVSSRDSCDAGGPGAIRCSVTCPEGWPTECETTCREPKYACCNCQIHPAKALCDCEE